jgi:hypothetical protein
MGSFTKYSSFLMSNVPLELIEALRRRLEEWEHKKPLGGEPSD